MIFLIGFMGCGKTTMGKRIASSMRLPFFDIDCLIEEAQESSIAGIFDSYGESYFRDLETRILEKIPENGVCATGGGIVLREKNRALLKAKKHRIILIDTPWEILWDRIKGSDRPLLKGKTESEIKRLWSERLPYYRECADITFFNPKSV